jgi:hypothetical protein
MSRFMGHEKYGLNILEVITLCPAPCGKQRNIIRQTDIPC